MLQSNIETVYDHIIAASNNPRLGKIPDRIVEQFSKRLEEAREERALATA